jgi:hypothetical protein
VPSIDSVLRERIEAGDCPAIRSKDKNRGNPLLEVLIGLLLEVAIEGFDAARKGRSIVFPSVERLNAEFWVGFSRVWH